MVQLELWLLRVEKDKIQHMSFIDLSFRFSLSRSDQVSKPRVSVIVSVAIFSLKGLVCFGTRGKDDRVEHG
jgi:hypothetical protein